MDQINIGFTYWQQPDQRKMPTVYRLAKNEIQEEGLAFQEEDGYVSIEAENYQKAMGTNKINWKVIPDLVKNSFALTTFPQNEYPAINDSVYLEYAINFESVGEFDLSLLVSPSLAFNDNKGLRYAIAFDSNNEQIVNINKPYAHREWQKWQYNRITKTTTKHLISNIGLHHLRIRILEPGIVLQKILIDTGGLKPSYLGAPESKQIKL